MATELSIEDRNGVIVVCAYGQVLGETLSIPLFAFTDIEALKRFMDTLSGFIEKHTMDIPQYIIDAFREE